MKIAFQGDSIAAVNDGSHDIRADDLLIELLPAATDVSIKHLVSIPLIGSHFFDGCFVQFVLLPLTLHSLSTFRADGRAWSHRRVVHDEFIDDDPIQERSLIVITAPVSKMILGRPGLRIYRGFR